MPFVIAEGKSLCCGKAGILGPGDSITADMVGGESNLKKLATDGFVAESGGKAPAASKPAASVKDGKDADK